MIVDASAMIELLLQMPKAERIATHLLAATDELAAPHLLDVEVAQVLRRLVIRNELAEDRAERALDALVQFTLRRHPHAPLVSRIWQWRHNLTAYDAAYVALAEALSAPLVTCDVRLSLAARDVVAVHVV